jgi:DNA adenine methylase Dam
MAIKYTGSKKWLVKSLRNMDEVYEPFAGSAIVSFQKAKVCHLNDTTEPLIEMYRQLSTNREGLIQNIQREEQIIKMSGNPAEAYYDARNRFNRGGMTDPALFCIILYLGFNGLWRVGPNGCSVPYGGDNRRFIPDSLRSIPVEKMQTLTNQSWESAPVPSDQCVIYADPPYATTFTKYNRRGWLQDDNIALFDWLASKENPVLVSCLNTPDNQDALRARGFDFIPLAKKYKNGVGSVTKSELLGFNGGATPYVVFNNILKQ